MFVPPRLGRWLNRILPRGVTRWLQRIYAPYHHWVVQRKSQRLLRQLFAQEDLSVKSGPFAGMKYVPQSGGSALVPKLLGSYEMELHPVFERVLERRYETVVDIGCAEGYYAIGLALRLPNAAVHAFDLVPESLAACRRLGEINGVASRLQLHGAATTENLSGLIQGNTLVVSDCEGVEVELLDPRWVPGLRRADIIVELHDRLVPGASAMIRERFSPTHDVTIISSRDREPGRFPLLNSLNLKDRRWALDEFRGGPMDWAFLEARP